MKILGIILTLLGLFKLLAANVLGKEGFPNYSSPLPVSQDDMTKYGVGALLADGLISLLCGVFIILL